MSMVPYQRRSPPGRTFALARASFQAGRHVARNLFSRQIKRRSQQSSRSNLRSNPIPITGENDVSQNYRRRRMPRRKRVAWKRFSRKVQAVDLKSLGSNYHVITRQEVLTSAGDKQIASHIHTVLGLNGDGFTNDVSLLFDRLLGANPNVSDKDASRLIVKGWLAETQVLNDGGTTCYLDLYYWRCKKPVPAALDSVRSVINNSFTDMASNFPLGGSSMSMTDYGVTPFQAPQFSQSFQVWKKIRTKLGVGGVTQIETRSGKNYFRSWGHDEEYSTDRCTEGVFMVAYGTPTALNTTSAPVTLRFSTNVNYTWTYKENAVQSAGTNAP